MELTEKIGGKRLPSGVAPDWLVGGATKERVLQEAAEGEKIMARLRLVLDEKFQSRCASEYDQASSERERAFDSGYRKCLKELYRLLQLDT